MLKPSKNLIVLCGAPASGKSTWSQNHDLLPYIVSFDAIRLELNPPYFGLLGYETVQDAKFFDIAMDRIKKRLLNGELVVVDATHTKIDLYNKYLQMAGPLGYHLTVVDFRGPSLETLLERNAARLPHQIVPDAVLTRMYEEASKLKFNSKWTVIKPDQFSHCTLESTKVDLTGYEEIVHIGDIQGMGTDIVQYFEENPISDKKCYIFTGDWIDRGSSNDVAVELFMKLAVLPNVIMIEGNHDTYLKDWAFGRPVTTDEFVSNTLPQLEAANLDNSVLRRAVMKLVPYFYYTFGGNDVLVTHAGISGLPEFVSTISVKNFIRGSGTYAESEICDTAFVANTADNTFSVHGHRNKHNVATRNTSRTFNLEGKVEFSGKLRIASLALDGWYTDEFPHTVAQNPTNITPGEGVEELVSQFEGCKLVSVKPLPQGIRSFNFSRDAFQKQQWTELSVQARGMFVNEHFQIVCRGYEKFFNFGERADQKALVFPVQVYRKENGYLGLIGYNPATDELVFATKSTTDGDFAGWLQKQFHARFNRQEIQSFKNYLSANNCTAVFEVIDPVNDPHIIEEKKKNLILLDLIKNQVVFERIEYGQSAIFAADMGLDFKNLELVLDSQESFDTWYASVLEDDKLQLEGYVLEDADSNFIKIKCPYYVYWKIMRSVLENVKKGVAPKPQKLELQGGTEFFNFLIAQKALGIEYTSIVKARKAFLKA
jgi:predicted kinase